MSTEHDLAGEQEPFDGTGPQEAAEPPQTGADDVLDRLPQTGDPGLDEMLRELALASAISLEDQLPVIEAVHRGLQDRLADAEG